MTTSPTPKNILLGAFEINGVNLTSQGLWAHPDQQTVRYTELSYWLEVAKILDEGGFDFLFFGLARKTAPYHAACPSIRLDVSERPDSETPLFFTQN